MPAEISVLAVFFGVGAFYSFVFAVAFAAKGSVKGVLFWIIMCGLLAFANRILVKSEAPVYTGEYKIVPMVVSYMAPGRLTKNGEITSKHSVDIFKYSVCELRTMTKGSVFDWVHYDVIIVVEDECLNGFPTSINLDRIVFKDTTNESGWTK